MQSLLEKIERAKRSKANMDDLLAEYLPFIRQEAGRHASLGIEYDDRVSFAMIAFMNCVRQYDASRGNFISYTAVSIRNRLIDEAKKQSRYAQHTVPLEQEDESDNTVSFQNHLAAREHQRQTQGAALAEEIDRLVAQLSDFGIELDSLDKFSPKHLRLRATCARVARALAADTAMVQRMASTRQLPVTRLAQLTGVPAKTIEKFRKYIITVALICSGDYSGICEFLPEEEGKPHA